MICCKFRQDGVIDVRASFTPTAKKNAAKDMARFGLTLEMPENFSTATVTGFTFEGKSYNFSEMDFLNPQ